jgi:hypothetical protein
MNKNINMIFYSEHCNACRNIMTILKNEDLLKNFKIICVDNILDKLPPDMQVPLMRLVNIPEPLYAQSIYKWIDQIKFMKKSSPNSNQPNIIPQMSKPQRQTGPYCYDADIMTKTSDSFALVDPTVNKALPQSYFGINQEEENAIYTPKDPENSKIKKEEQKKILSEIESRRNQQNNEFVQYSKQAQLELITQDEHDRQQQTGTYSQQNIPVNKPKKGITLIKH